MSKLEFSAEIIRQDNINFKFANELYIFIPFTPQSIIIFSTIILAKQSRYYLYNYNSKLCLGIYKIYLKINENI